MKNSEVKIQVSISCEYESNISIKLRNHVQSYGHVPVKLTELGLDCSLYVKAWGSKYSIDEGFVRFTADLTNTLD